MTSTERNPELSGDEAAEQRSAPNLDAGVVGDLVEALRPFATLANEFDGNDTCDPEADNHEFAGFRSSVVGHLRKARAALAKYATQGTGGGVDDLPRNFELSYGYCDRDEDLEDDGWCVHSVNGGVNDREWTLVAKADTPSEAIRKALATHQPAISTDRSGT